MSSARSASVTAAPIAATPQQLGRFRLLSSLGEGAQAKVWLAHDPRLDREVAVKVLHAGVDPISLDEWLHEARAVSRLTHPNIVPVFEAEADTQAGQFYMVFEYVAGGTLSQRLRGRGALAAREAVELSLQTLDGLQAAHAAGVIHRDLKPSNILLDANQRVRVMDFGIAARLSETPKAQRIVGSPGYISPEAAQGAPAHAQMDVFAAAVMLAEMLSGQRLNHHADPLQAVRRVITQELLLPSGLGADVDDNLRAIVQRGLARDPAQRWPDAQAFHTALAQWLHPAQSEEFAVKQSATLEFLLRRMRHRSDLPAMTDAIMRIQRLTQSEHESLATLSNEILKDVALTQKLLRLVNTVNFKHAGSDGGVGISTVSRAVALIGFAGIRNMALSLIFLERMENKGHAQLLREEFLRSLMAASLARELCLNEREGEEAFLCALFHSLGRSLTEFYFPEEAQQIRRITRPERSRPGSANAAAPISEAAAAVQVLGMSFEYLGLGVAKQWGMPESLQQSMRRPEGEPPTKLVTSPVERQRWLAHAVNEVADLILQTEPAQAHGRVQVLAQRYARALGVSAAAFYQAATQARQQLAQMAQAMAISLPENSPALRLLARLEPATDDLLSAHHLQATQVLESPSLLGKQQLARAQAVETLASGIQDVIDAMVDDFKLNDVLRMILEAIYRGLGFRRVVFCWRDAKTNTLTGRFGLGEGVDSRDGLVAAFKIALRPPAAGVAADFFSLVCQKGVDTLIADASVATIAARLPAWYVSNVHAPSFLLLPMAMKGVPFALIYADKAVAGSIDLGEKELSLLRTLRNQAVMAFKQAS
jgi:serine/threonine protein kinase